MNPHHSVRRLLLILTLASSLSAQQKAAPAAAPDQPSGPVSTLAVDARLVNLPVVVRDKKGALIQNLTKDNFTLQVDGKPQAIRYFDKDTNLPLILGLLVDTSVSQRSVLDDERSASGVFLDQMLTTPKDQAFVIQFASETELLQDLTSSRPKLQAALREIDTPPDISNTASTSSDPNDPNNSGSNRRAHRGTVLYDALFLASDEIMSKQKGRKALIILSDGGDNGSRENLVRSIEAAQRADTIVYAIYFKGDEPQHTPDNNQHQGRGGYPGGGYPGGGYPGGGYPGGGYPGGGYPGGPGGYPGGNGGGSNYPPAQRRTDGKKNLERMVNETGGRLFEIKKNQDVAQIYTQIAEELRAQYRLGYTPSQDAAAGYHQVNLSTNQKGLTIQTRDGYYTGKAAQGKAAQ
jgi:VWFA-related protein